MKSRASVPVFTYRQDYSVNNVLDSAWYQIAASLGADVNTLEIFDSSGQVLELAYGPAASETRAIFIMPGGNTQLVNCLLSKGMRLAVRAVTGSPINSGQLVINGYK